MPDLFIGTYTQNMGHVPNGHGAGVVQMSTDSGRDSSQQAFPAGVNPAALCMDRTRTFVFACQEVEDGQNDGVICVGKYDKTSKKFTSFMGNGSGNRSGIHPDHGGWAPCYLTTDLNNRFLICANYGSGALRTSGLTVYRYDVNTLGQGGNGIGGGLELVEYAGIEQLLIEQMDGSWRDRTPNEQDTMLPIGQKEDRQECSHFHCVEMRKGFFVFFLFTGRTWLIFNVDTF